METRTFVVIAVVIGCPIVIVLVGLMVGKVIKNRDGALPLKDEETNIVPNMASEGVGHLYLRSRRLRADQFGADDLAESAWGMLVDLYLSRGMDERSITNVCDASRLSPTTALRWVGKLCDAGLVSRVPDERDARRVNLRLTAEGEERAEGWLAILKGVFERGGQHR